MADEEKPPDVEDVVVKPTPVPHTKTKEAKIPLVAPNLGNFRLFTRESLAKIQKRMAVSRISNFK